MAGSAQQTPVADFVPLPGGRWWMWRQTVLRSAGFPANRVATLGDTRLAEVADAVVGGGATRAAPDADFDGEFALAATRLAVVVRGWARDDVFREAVTWQNPQFVADCLDRIEDGAPRNWRYRRREAAIASYVQRYTTKNDTIGFFGPAGWAEWDVSTTGLRMRPGPGLVRNRCVYFEQWAVDELARVIAGRTEVRPGVPPRRIPAYLYLDDCVVRQAGQRVPLSAEESQVLRLCDGVRTVHHIGRQLLADGLVTVQQRLPDILRHLEDRGVVRMDFGGPIEAYPERRLESRLRQVPDEGPRDRGLRDLDELVRAKQQVAAAAGAPGRLGAGIRALNERFETQVARPATRLPGQTYAGRTVVYEDTVRDVELRLGGDVLAAVGEPLALILDSARWLTARIGSDYLDLFGELYERKRKRTGEQWVPLGGVLALATRDLYTARGAPPLAAAATAELQRRWAEVLRLPPGVRRHRVRAADIADPVRRCFASASPPWVGARVHSPDVMIAARSAEAANRGEYALVLGELHVAFNTVESRNLVEQSADPGRLLAMAETAVGAGRVVVVAPREWPRVNSRTCPPTALLSPRYVYVAIGDDDTSNIPGPVLPIGGLEVGPGTAGLAVRCRSSRREFRLADVVGDYLSGVAVNGFRMMPPQPHTPRVMIDRLVVARETWRMPLGECDWARETDERRRYLRMRQWVHDLGLPRQVFWSVDTEIKPIYADFTSIALTTVFANSVRRAVQAGAGGLLVLSEMCPSTDELWLVDAAGAAYTSELRLVVTDRGPLGSTDLHRPDHPGGGPQAREG
jgi:hypothetical protein